MATKLQLRWEKDEDPNGFGWLCHYELSLELDEHDIRREDDEGAKVRSTVVLPISKTRRGGGREPCRNGDGTLSFDAPYRDGAHAKWDAPKLGNLPIVCIALDGTEIPRPADDPAALATRARATHTGAGESPEK